MRYRKSILDAGEGIMMLESRHNDGRDPHSHEFIELVYIASGKGIHSIGGKSYVLSAGDLFIIHTADDHSLQPVSGEKESFSWINCLFVPEFYPFDLSVFPLSNKYAGTQGFEMAYLFQSMVQEFRDKQPGYLAIMRGCLGIVLHKLSRLLQEKNEEVPYAQRKMRSNLKRAVEWIHREYESPIGLEAIAAELGTSTSYVGKLFKQELGMTPVTYVNRHRAERSCKLLAETHLPVHQIAVQAGFKDLKFYYAFFKRIFGMTPGEYRSKYGMAKMEPAEPARPIF